MDLCFKVSASQGVEFLLGCQEWCIIKQLILSTIFFKSFGIVFVVDASDIDRLEECKKALQETEMQPRVAGKPLLM